MPIRIINNEVVVGPVGVFGRSVRVFVTKRRLWITAADRSSRESCFPRCGCARVYGRSGPAHHLRVRNQRLLTSWPYWSKAKLDVEGSGVRNIAQRFTIFAPAYCGWIEYLDHQANQPSRSFRRRKDGSNFSHEHPRLHEIILT